MDTKTLDILQREHAVGGIMGHEDDCPMCQNGVWPEAEKPEIAPEDRWGYRVHATGGKVFRWRWEVLHNGELYTYISCAPGTPPMKVGLYGACPTKRGAERVARRKAARKARQSARWDRLAALEASRSLLYLVSRR